ncbi:MAG: HD domain-containing phosphohydrolase [Sedimentibacter sp.]|uniref:diguanylate cyclase n=1 Tax=Sedimentibacter sp. TaxID=1960295 RepID=UPI003157F47D
MKETQTGKKTISIRFSIIILFVSSMLITVSYIGYQVFSGWIESTDNNIKIIAENTNAEIYNQVSEFIKNPLHMNESNYMLIENGIINLHNEKEREKYFAGILKSHEGDYFHSFAIGLETGEYYGAVKKEDGTIILARENQQTGGEAWYYNVQEDLTAGDFVESYGKYDPRTREWYQAAKGNKETVYSKDFKHFYVNEMVISASTPIYNTDGNLKGVLATHLTLSIIDDYIKNIVIGKNMEAYIADKETGNLIANSVGIDNYIILEEGSVTRYSISDLGNGLIEEAYEKFMRDGTNSMKLKTGGDYLYVKINEYQNNGLDWICITAMSDRMFMKSIKDNFTQTVLLVLFALILSLLVYLAFTYKAFKPMEDLIETTEKFAKGDLKQRATVFRDDEIGKITVSFNRMADTMYQLVNNLEEKVRERTQELDRTNNELRENVEQIKYLSYHDSLTGLYNRMYFEDALKRLDKNENLPISIIFGDVNGLKLTNDVFGHGAGDELLKKAAETLKKACRSKDIVARMGGDEFAIILPNTSSEDAENITARIRTELTKEQISAIKCSMSLGFDTKEDMDKDLVRILENAEEFMYKCKTLNRENVNSELIKTIIATLHKNSPRELQHSVNVGSISAAIGKKLGLPKEEALKLRQAGYMHDIGKIAIRKETMEKNHDLSKEESKEMQQHTVAGYRILNLFDETMNLAESVMSHHEMWDGTGYPNRLKGEEIPLSARIIAVAEDYDILTNPDYGNNKSKEEALEEIRRLSGTKYDPNIVDAFVSTMAE